MGRKRLKERDLKTPTISNQMAQVTLNLTMGASRSGSSLRQHLTLSQRLNQTISTNLLLQLVESPSLMLQSVAKELFKPMVDTIQL